MDGAHHPRRHSTDSSKGGGGDIGYVTAGNARDAAWLKAVFAFPTGGTTGVVVGADGACRIGRVIEIVPAALDPQYQQRVEQAMSLAVYREAVRDDLTRARLSDAIVASATTGNQDQVHLWEIGVDSASSSDVSGPEVRAAHILFAPRDDPSNAASLPATDPSWEASQTEALAAAGKFRAIAAPEQRAQAFHALAKTGSDDAASSAGGGELGWFARTSMVAAFSDAVFAGAHAAGDISGPVKTQFGWHVILFEGSRASAQGRLKAVQGRLAAGDDFATVAKALSDAPDAAEGGDMGWVAALQLQVPPQVNATIFALKAGDVSAPQQQPAGTYMYLVTAIASRPVDARQKAALEAAAFDNWYAAQKAAASMTREASPGGRPLSLHDVRAHRASDPRPGLAGAPGRAPRRT